MDNLKLNAILVVVLVAVCLLYVVAKLYDIFRGGQRLAQRIGVRKVWENRR